MRARPMAGPCSAQGAALLLSYRIPPVWATLFLCIPHRSHTNAAGLLELFPVLEGVPDFCTERNIGMTHRVKGDWAQLGRGAVVVCLILLVRSYLDTFPP